MLDCNVPLYHLPHILYLRGKRNKNKGRSTRGGSNFDDDEVVFVKTVPSPSENALLLPPVTPSSSMTVVSMENEPIDTAKAADIFKKLVGQPGTKNTPANVFFQNCTFNLKD